MRRLGFVIVTMLLWLGLAVPAMAQSPDPYAKGPHIAITLTAESTAPAPGGTVTIAYDAVPQPGWHGYWQNPGDAGFPAKLIWTLPPGVTADAPRYPVPTTLLIGEGADALQNYVFDQRFTPLIDLHLPPDLAPGTKLPIRLKASYLVCTDQICVPEKADLALDLVVGDGAITPEARARFDAFRQALPKPLGAAATYQRDAKGLRLAIPYPAGAPLSDAYFFATTPNRVAYNASQKVTRDGDRLILETQASKPVDGPIEGVLRIGKAQGLLLRAEPGVVPVPVGQAPMAAWLPAALLALGGALLGGLILNVMPCVFPILSLKALQLARGGVDEGEARREALAYTAGVLSVIVGLGAAILALRAGGTAVGWAFQLQNPGVVAVLLLLVAALTLNLAGLFEIPTPRFVDSASGASGAFATGALAAIIATPCTGPFMGAALGAALVLPWYAGLGVFAGLGLGLALPFLAIGFVPALRRALPKPGAWMAHFRHFLALPMGLTAVWLAWVLGGEAGVDGMAIGLAGIVGIAAVLFLVGERQRRGLGAGLIALVALAAVTGATAWAVKPQAKAASTSTGAQPFSEEALATLRANRKPVFVYFTADWCLTCKVNERVAIDTDPVQAAFAKHGVSTLVGDWTSGDAKLGRFIEAHNRAGVPLYLYYAVGAREPEVLPQVLTPDLLIAKAGS
ncbi:MAG: thioredoxin family protein [Sphingomonas sp.]|uniref:protein-disulfide reductase DsbD family protein n=1 Tax=Sphingomonas sp. TaxID=28214 RepID=UPI0025D60812|nr:thioredoxin family protein [Sphingomonas sp.]MBX9882330.1 thioredoxin family protein [Sphingomonas sp.]